MSNDGKKVLAFLLDRKVHLKFFKVIQEDPETADNLETLQDVKAEVGRRLLVAGDSTTVEGSLAAVIVSERGQTFHPDAPSGTQLYPEFKAFMGDRAPWLHRDRTEYVNLLEEDADNGREALDPFSWVQLGCRNCYMQAVAAMFCYLCHWHKVESDDTLLDIPRFMRRYFDADKIWKHVFGKDGGQSKDVLNSLIGKEWKLKTFGQANEPAFEFFPPYMMNFLEHLGPILATNMVLPKNFQSDSTVPMRGSSADFPTRANRAACHGRSGSGSA